MHSSNPVLGRLGRVANHERVAARGAGIHAAPEGYGRPADPYGQPSGYATAWAPATTSRAMTLDDVVTRTVLLVALTGMFGAAAWVLLPPAGALTGLAMFGSAIAGLVLGLVITFARITNPLVISGYAAVQGVLLGVVSHFYESLYAGIVLQAVVGTFAVFAGMAALYRFRVLRATPRFTRFVVGALIGVVALSLLNWMLYLFHIDMGLVSYDPNRPVGVVPLLFTLVCVVVGALTFVLDFEMVAQGTRYGLPEKYAWYCAFGLLVGLIFLYWQILRLLGYMRR